LERNFSFLKDPLIVNDLFLKKRYLSSMVRGKPISGGESSRNGTPGELVQALATSLDEPSRRFEK
jgi:hypothetical protein